MSATCPECDGYVLTVIKETKHATIFRCEDCSYVFKIRYSDEVDDDD